MARKKPAKGRNPSYPGHTTRTTPAKIDKAERTARALRLKKAGMTFRDISRIMEISLGQAHELVDSGLKEIPELERAELTKDIVEREYGLIAAHWRTRKDPDSAKIIQASHKTLVAIFGLEAPKRTELTGADGVPLIPPTTDVTRLTQEQLEALTRGDVAGVAGPSGDGAPETPGEPEPL